MKIVICTCLTLLTINTVIAQSAIDRNQIRQNITRAILRYQTSKSLAANKTTSTKERLIARDTYSGSASAYTDSAIYKYTGTHGSIFDFNYMDYSQSTETQYDGPITNFIMYTYNAPALQPLVVADTSIEYVGTITATPTTTIYSTYNSYNEPTTINSLYTATSGYYYQFNYNALHQPISIYSYGDTIGFTLSDTMTKRFMTYNSSNQLIQDSTFYYSSGSWNLFLKYTYSYDASGNLSKIIYYANSGSALYPFETYMLTFNSSNQLVTFVTDTGASVTPDFKETFQYTSGINYITSDTFYTWKGTSWGVPYYTISKHLNAVGLPDTVTTLNYDSSTIYSTELSIFDYDTYNNPIQDYDSLYYSGGGLINTYHYYYQTYTIPSSVANIMQQPEHVTIYPNPTNNYITIRTDKNEPIRITIANMYGQWIVNTSLQNAGNEHTISVANISPVNYQISVYDGDNTLLHSQLFIKE